MLAERDELRRWASEAILVQDACNLSGVVHSFSRLMAFLCAIGLDTEARNRHPIAVLFASKVASLTGCERMERFSESYEWCKTFR